jgi:saccharopine dehydrogenase-like NADP-dependent oxidoreductase
MSRILVLGGAGSMGSTAVRDLSSRTDHELIVGDLRPSTAEALVETLPRAVGVRPVDVDDPRSLTESLRGVDLVLNATYMRQNVAVTRAAIRAGVHLVDLGAYWPETRDQLALDAEAGAAGSRVVAGCGVAPGLTNVLARLGAERLDAAVAVRIWSYITHPMETSPGIVYTRFDASRGLSLVLRNGSLEERESFGDEELVGFPEPYGRRLVHLVPHPEPLTLPRTLPALRDVVFKVGYPAEETARIRALLELELDSAEPFAFGEATIVPRDFVAAFIGRHGLGPGVRTANVKRVEVEGELGGERVTLTYDLAVERDDGTSASSAIAGTAAAVAADLVARGAGQPGVRAPEAAFDPVMFLAELAERGFTVVESRAAGAGA